MKLTVYGPGCAKCKKAEEIAHEAVAQAGVEAEVEKVSDIIDIAKAGVIMTPAVAIDGEIVVRGKVPKLDELVSLITSAQAG